MRAASAGATTASAPGEPTGFNPLALPDTPPTAPSCATGSACCSRPKGRKSWRSIAAAVDAAYANDPSLRRLALFPRAARRARAARSRATSPTASTRGSTMASTPGCSTTPTTSSTSTSRVLGFDMTALLESPRLRTPVMMYLFHRIEERLDGEPTMILIDEGWKALDDEVFAARIRDWLKTLRKRNALVGFATQSARDALDSRISTALVEQTATMIFMPNARARGRGLLRRASA